MLIMIDIELYDVVWLFSLLIGDIILKGWVKGMFSFLKFSIIDYW